MMSPLSPAASSTSSLARASMGYPLGYRPALQALPRTLRYGSLLAGMVLLATVILTVLITVYLTTHALIFPTPTLRVSLVSEGSAIHPMDTVRLSVRPIAGRQLTYSWSLGDGASASGQQVTHQYASYGYYAVTVSAHDPAGQTGSAHLVVTVLPDPPQAEAKVVSQGANGLVALDASSSTGASLQFNWDFGDGSAGVFSLQPQVTHTYAHTGKYSVTLTVIDAAGQTSTAQVAVTVV